MGHPLRGSAPAAELRHLFPDSEAREGLRDACVRIGSRFRVDMTTLAIRLVRDLSLAAADSFDTIRRFRTTKFDFIRLSLLNPPEEFAGVTQTLLYQQAALRLFEGERISAHRAVELLEGTVGFEDLPPRPAPAPLGHCPHHLGPRHAGRTRAHSDLSGAAAR